jgi:hypothetical protein
MDTLQLEVGMSGNREMYSWAGSREFQEQQLGDLVGKGVVGTGHFALLAKHVFFPGAAKFRYKGITEVEGRSAHEWTFDVPAEKSRYRLRTGSGDAAVSFQGSVWADPESLSLIRLELAAYDIPEKLKLAEANNVIRYARVPIGDVQTLLPVSSELTLVAVDGNESHNRLKLGDCRQFRGEAVLTFAGEDTEASETPAAEPAKPVELPARAVLEVELAEPLRPEKVTVGEMVRVVFSKPVADGQRVLVPQGAEAKARLVRLEKQDLPYPMWEVGLQLSAVRVGDREVEVAATMFDAGPESGLVKQSRQFMPTFTKKRTNRMDILVRETPKGQGVLHWDARRDLIPKGLRMKWRIE